MKHKITTTKTKDQAETVLECEFEDAAIAGLISLEQAGLQWDRWKRRYVYNALGLTAQKDDKTFTFRTYQENAELPLQEIAQALEAQEAQYLPIMRYFNARAKVFNENLKAYYEELDKRLNALEYQMKDLGNHCRNNDERITGLAETAQDLRFQLNNHCDKVGELDEEVTALQKLYEGLRGLFFQHIKQRFHFSRREEKNQPTEMIC
jgi:chromosome segregation ATPase